MKKFYLLIMSFVVLATVSNAQDDCPTPKPIAINYPNSGNVPQYCKVVYTGGFYPAQLSLKVGATLIPVWGSNPADYYVDVQPDGSATFIYDCATYGNAAFAQIEQVIAGQVVKTCQVPVVTLGPLPMKVTSFTGRLSTESTVSLDWTSVIEFNSYQYQVERSADGKNFTKVGTLNAAGSSNDAIKYNFKDQLPASGDYFYRLKQVDIDGTAEYSKVVYVNSRKGSGIVTKLFPNPFQSEIQLIGATSADLNTPGNVKVFTMSGQLVNFRIVGANSIAIDPNAAKGIYFLRFRNSTEEKTFKIIKQ